MDTKQFAKLIQAIVREETTKIVRSEMKKMKAEILKEIKSTPRKKVRSSQGLTDSDIDSLVAARLAEMRGEKPKRQKKQVRRKPVRQKAEKYSNDSGLNSILEETAMYSDFSEHDDGKGWRTMNNGQAFGSREAIARSYGQGYDDMDMPEGMQNPNMYGYPGQGASVEDMIPDKDTRGMHMRVNADALPDGLKNALTRDYSSLMKVMNKDIKAKKAERGLDR